MQTPIEKYKIFKLYEPDLIKEFITYLDTLEKIEGIHSLSVGFKKTPESIELERSLKRNLEAGKRINWRNLAEFPEIDAWLYEKLKLDNTSTLLTQEWNDWILPKTNSGMLYSCMDEGGFYKPHIDHPSTGMFSSTLFLEEPNKYDGGELQLLIDDQLLEFKLDPGYCVTYETGTPHQVKKVTKGTRKCCIWWTRSTIYKLKDLYKYREAIGNSIMNRPSTYVYPNYPYNLDDITDDLREFSKKEHVYWGSIAHQIQREYL